MQIQRSINEGILGIRNKLKGDSANNEEASLTVRFKRFPEVPATKAFRNRLCDGDPSAEAQVGVWIFLAIMVDFLIAIITVVGEKEKGLLGAMRTVGVNELYLLVLNCFILEQYYFFPFYVIDYCWINVWRYITFFKYTEFGVLFPLLYVLE